MDAPSLLDRLMQHRTLGDAPVQELHWLIAHGEIRHVAAGDVYMRKGDAPTKLWIVLSGAMAIYVDRGLGPRRVMEWRAGDVSGGMPYSRVKQTPGDVVAVEASDLLLVSGEHFPEIVRECPTITTRLVHVLLDRARAFTSSDLQDEKMVSLGRIAAGLAHELNNPASAARRSAQVLTAVMDQAELSTRVLASAGLTDAQLGAIDRARQVCNGSIRDLTPLDRADREQDLDTWLSEHGGDPTLAGALLDTGATAATLDELGRALQGPAFDAAARWIAACCAIRTIAGEIDTASSRIYDLVSAIKRFSYMDQTQAVEAMDIAQGLHDSVALLQHKARSRSVTLALSLPPSMPRVKAIGSDLNQVWTNLVDNALDAASSHVHVTASAARGGVLVSVVDDGPGIPAEIRERIFDAFFTTKGVGKGTGLGLETARRLVLRNSGDIEVDSRPGHTEFRVLLPAA